MPNHPIFQRRLGIVLGLVAAAIALFLCISASVELFTDHDEHQFVVPGLFTVQQGLLPYRDYPLFHMPYLVMVQGALGAATGWPLLSARLLTGIAGWLILVVLGTYTWRRLADCRWRIPLAIGLPTLLLFQPVFPGTLAYSWNHCTPVLVALVATLLHLRAPESPRARWIFFISGSLLALATGMRLTFLPLFAPFGLTILLLPARSWRERLQFAAFFSGGALIAALPVFYLFSRAPEQFLFGNFGYPKLSMVWRRYPIWHAELAKFVDPVLGFLDPLNEGMKGRDLSAKLRRVLAVTVKDNWPLLCAFCLCAFATLATAIRHRKAEPRIRFLAITLPFVIWGCLAPSRFHPQYYFALMPTLVLGCVEAIRFLGSAPQRQNLLAGSIFLLTLISIPLGLKKYAFATRFADFEKWGPVMAHRAAHAASIAAGPGKILTLDPLIVAEAGMATYPEFSSGEFAWRTAHLLPLAKRQRYHMVTLSDLDTWLAGQPPASLFLSGQEKRQNPPLIKWAEERGYKKSASFGQYGVWVKTESSPQPSHRGELF